MHGGVVVMLGEALSVSGFLWCLSLGENLRMEQKDAASSWWNVQEHTQSNMSESQIMQKIFGWSDLHTKTKLIYETDGVLWEASCLHCSPPRLVLQNLCWNGLI